MNKHHAPPLLFGHPLTEKDIRGQTYLFERRPYQPRSDADREAIAERCAAAIVAEDAFDCKEGDA